MATALWTNNTADGTSTEVEVTGPATITFSGTFGGCQQIVEARYGSSDFEPAGENATRQGKDAVNVNMTGTFEVRLRQILSGPNTSVSAEVQGS